MYDFSEETAYIDPITTEADIVGFYRPDIAAAASAATASDPGSGPMRMDD